MKINVGDKILMKKVEDLPEKLKNDEEYFEKVNEDELGSEGTYYE